MKGIILVDIGVLGKSMTIPTSKNKHILNHKQIVLKKSKLGSSTIADQLPSGTCTDQHRVSIHRC
jgi:hypothetical protein